MSLTSGTRLGPYEIQSPIGAGGMGEVYLARDTRLDRTVAIKVLPPELSADPDRRARFKLEAKAIAGLNHPHICVLHDIGEHEGCAFLVMELLEGESLRQRLTQARPGAPEIVDISLQLADALEAAHAKGVVHRDLKPENIFVTTRGTAKLLDFGIAKLVTEEAAATAAVTATRIGTGPVALGTVAYMSPEQVRGEALDARTDLFSLGVVLYEMATGTQPFRGTTSGAVLGEILTKTPSAPVHLNADVPPELERIVNKLLEKDRELRYQSARDLRVDLERLRRASTAAATATPAVSRTRHAEAAETAFPSIAVLPFVNMSGDKEQEYFSDGLAEEVINALAHVPGMKVIARTSAFAFKGKQEDVRRIAEVLGVANILEGSVRKAGNRVRVTAQLVSAGDGSHLWSERYDRDLTDVFGIQDEIASAITAALQVRLSSTPTRASRRDPDPEAYESYLKAIYLLWRLSPEAVARSRECFERTITLDPGFALGHLGLAQHSWILAHMGYVPARQAMPVVRTEAERALSIEPDLPEAHAMLGVVAAAYDYDWREAERRFRLAVGHEPAPPEAHSWYAYYCLLPQGRAEDAANQARQALAADPLSIAAHCFYGSCLVGARRLTEAQAQANTVRDIEETQLYACSILAFSYALQAQWPLALACAEAAQPRAALIYGMLAGILERTGDDAGAEALMATARPGNAYGAPLALAWYNGIAGKLDEAAEWFEKAAEQRQPDAPHHAFLVLQSIPRWPSLARTMKLTPELR